MNVYSITVDTSCWGGIDIEYYIVFANDKDEALAKLENDSEACFKRNPTGYRQNILIEELKDDINLIGSISR